MLLYDCKYTKKKYYPLENIKIFSGIIINHVNKARVPNRGFYHYAVSMNKDDKKYFIT